MLPITPTSCYRFQFDSHLWLTIISDNLNPGLTELKACNDISIHSTTVIQASNEKISCLEWADEDKYYVADLNPIPQRQASVLRCLEIDKNNGIKCPQAHIRMYVQTLDTMSLNLFYSQSTVLSPKRRWFKFHFLLDVVVEKP